MRITVVGAILIIAGAIIVILVLGNLLDRGNRGPKPNNLQRPEGNHTGLLGA